jgi:hypothetical protein
VSAPGGAPDYGPSSGMPSRCAPMRVDERRLRLVLPCLGPIPGTGLGANLSHWSRDKSPASAPERPSTWRLTNRSDRRYLSRNRLTRKEFFWG